MWGRPIITDNIWHFAILYNIIAQFRKKRYRKKNIHFQIRDCFNWFLAYLQQLMEIKRLKEDAHAKDINNLFLF